MTTDRTAITTGASSGIGRAIAERLTSDGIRIGLLGRDPGRVAEAAATWHEVLDRTLTGTFYTVLALARHLPRPGGE